MDRSTADILNEAEVIAVIGCSKSAHRTSHMIARYLMEKGYTVVPVHPEYEEVLGQKVYPTVYDIPEEIQIDIVDIFRRSEHTADMVDDILTRVERTGRKPVVWTQLGVSSEEARKKSEEAGLRYVEEKCIMVEHQRLAQ